MSKRWKRSVLRAVCCLLAFTSALSLGGCTIPLGGFFSSSDSSSQPVDDSSYESTSVFEEVSSDNEEESLEDISVEEGESISDEENFSTESSLEESETVSDEENSSEESLLESEEESSVEESDTVSDDENSNEESLVESEEESSLEESESTSEDATSSEESIEDSSIEDSVLDSVEDSVLDSSSEENTLDFTFASLEMQYGYQQFANESNGAKLQNFYEDFYEKCLQFYTSQQDVQAKTVSYVGGATATVYTIGDVYFGQYNLSVDEAITVWSVALLELPEFYWLAHTTSYTTTKLSIYIDEEYATYSARQQVQQDVSVMAEECYSYLREDMSQTERALSIQEYVLGNLTYAYKADGVTAEDACWAHNIEGLAKGLGVCESYAKAYDYLCGLMGINCITVSGLGGEGSAMGGHAWNMVEIDGVWYDVDVTWEDAYANPQRDWIGVPHTEFSQTHIPNSRNNGYGNTWLYPLPMASETRLQPVSMTENGGKEIFYPNLDTAFAKMINEDSTYVVYLCPETDAGVNEGVVVYPYAHTFAMQTIPDVGNITLSGKYVSTTKHTVATAQNAITLTSPLRIEYGTIEYPYTSTGTARISLGTKGMKKSLR